VVYFIAIRLISEDILGTLNQSFGAI